MIKFRNWTNSDFPVVKLFQNSSGVFPIGELLHNLLLLRDLVSSFLPLASATYLSHHQWQPLDQLDNLDLLKILLNLQPALPAQILS